MIRVPRFAAAVAAILVLAGCGAEGGDGSGREASGGGTSTLEDHPSLESLPGALYDPPRPAPALRLTDADGQPFDLAKERGHVVLVFFGFTECPDVCPATLQKWKEVRAALGPDSSLARFVFVSVDPENDTPAAAAAYVRRFDPAFTGLSGTDAEIGQVALAWGVSKGSAHTTQVFVVNPEGLIPWGYGRSASVEQIAAGIRAVAARGAPE